MTLSFDIIVFHNWCPDGVTGLWCAHHLAGGIEFEKIGISADDDPYGDFTNKNIIFIDVSPSIEWLIENLPKANKITILDHHKSACVEIHENLARLSVFTNLELVLDNLRSGCQIAWDYFFPNTERPWFVNYVGDQDLWTWVLPHSKEINSVLDFNDYIDQYDLTKLDTLLMYGDNEKLQLVNEGMQIAKFKNKMLTDELEWSDEAKFIIDNKIYNIQLAGAITSDTKSDLGNMLSEKLLENGSLPDFGVVWDYYPKYNQWKLSLRGNDISPDLSEIARKLGGGGHPAASGVTLNESPFGKLIIFESYEE
jgi:oligoribonuclease NrnB/cAMP/cGMP phosphodiesterase (DHH superfamily)